MWGAGERVKGSKGTKEEESLMPGHMMGNKEEQNNTVRATQPVQQICFSLRFNKPTAAYIPPDRSQPNSQILTVNSRLTCVRKAKFSWVTSVIWRVNPAEGGRPNRIGNCSLLLARWQFSSCVSKRHFAPLNILGTRHNLTSRWVHCRHENDQMHKQTRELLQSDTYRTEHKRAKRKVVETLDITPLVGLTFHTVTHFSHCAGWTALCALSTTTACPHAEMTIPWFSNLPSCSVNICRSKKLSSPKTSQRQISAKAAPALKSLWVHS